MKPTCWTKEGTEIKGGVVTFQGNLVSHGNAMRIPDSPSHLEIMFPGNDLHRPKVNQTYGKMFPMDVIEPGTRNAQPHKHLALAKVKNILRQREGREYQVILLNGYGNPGWGVREAPI